MRERERSEIGKALDALDIRDGRCLARPQMAHAPDGENGAAQPVERRGRSERREIKEHVPAIFQLGEHAPARELVQRRARGDARRRKVDGEGERMALPVHGDPLLFQLCLDKIQLAAQGVRKRLAPLFHQLDAVFDACHDEIGRAGGAEQVERLARVLFQRLVVDIEKGALREDGQRLVRAVHPGVRIIAGIVGLFVRIEAQGGAVRLVRRSSLP